jgi:5-formyltetrahydrofolate cyclo-ligase
MERDARAGAAAGAPQGRPPDARGRKALLRRDLLAARRRRATGAAEDSARVARALALPELARARRDAARAPTHVALYASLAGEPATTELLDALRAAGVRVLLPSVLADRNLVFREHVGELVAGRFGTREPPAHAPNVDLAMAAVVVVPALAVDLAGRRLGRGGGSYDRALARLCAGATVVTLLHDSEIIARVPTEPHDRPVDVVVTPSRVLRLPLGRPDPPTDGT